MVVDQRDREAVVLAAIDLAIVIGVNGVESLRGVIQALVLTSVDRLNPQPEADAPSLSMACYRQSRRRSSKYTAPRAQIEAMFFCRSKSAALKSV